MSKNRLTVFPKGTFSNLTTLFIFILYDNPLSQIDCEMFSGFHVRIIHSNNFQICCIVQSVHLIYTHLKHWYNSCNNLLPNDSLNIFLVLVSTLVLLVNFQFIILQLRHAKNSYFCIVITLSLTYVSFSLYLITVWFVHLHYGKCFVTEIFHWRDSVVCASISTGILCYNLLQPSLLVLLSLAHLLAVICPFDSKFLSKTFTLKVIFVVLLMIIVFSAICGYVLRLQGSPNNLCIPFVDPSQKLLLPWTFTITVSFFQILTIFIMLGMYLLVVRSLKNTNAARSSKNVNYYQKVKKHVILLMVSKIISWIPTNVVYLTAIVMNKYPIIMTYWTTVIIMPTSAILIPIVLTLNKRNKPQETVIKAAVRTG